MPTAFVFVNTETGLESDVLMELKALDSVKEALLVYGLYDIILLVEFTSMHNLKQFVTWKIRKMQNIKDTQTVVPI